MVRMPDQCPAAAGPRPIVLLGPTAGGKSDLAVAIAEKLVRQGIVKSAEILSADSMQVYRLMDAGTAKPSSELRSRVTHHFIDLIDPTERYTVADWLHQADALIQRLRSRDALAIVVGGTNLYIKALLEGMFQGPDFDPAQRQRLEAMSDAALRQRLNEIDPVAAQRIHPNDRKRTIRAIEVYEASGQRLSDLQLQWSPPPPPTSPPTSPTTSPTIFPPSAPLPVGGNSLAQPEYRQTTYRHNPVLIGMDWPTPAINQRINRRVKEMFHHPSLDLIAETRRLEEKKLLGPQARLALGYRQVLEHLDGKCSADDAIEQTKILTRRFAKTQRTWLKRYANVFWMACENRSTDELADQAIAHYPPPSTLSPPYLHGFSPEYPLNKK